MVENQQGENPYKDIYQFASNQVSESRQAFERYYKLTLGSILLIATIVVAATFWLLGRQFADIEATVQERADKQIQLLQEEVRNRIDEEFRTERIQSLIQDVVREKTERGLRESIQQAVAQHVETRVKAEQPSINRTVLEETKKAVSQLEPSIRIEVSKRVDAALIPFNTRMKQTEEILRVGTLAILARNGDGGAYDQLMGLGQTSKNPDVRSISVTTYNQIYLEFSSALYMTRSFKVETTKKQLLAYLDDSHPMNRKAAIDTLVSQREKSIVPKLLQIAEHDPFMLVRRAAFNGLRSLTGQDIRWLDMKRWRAWWEKNKAIWPPKE